MKRLIRILFLIVLLLPNFSPLGRVVLADSSSTVTSSETLPSSETTQHSSIITPQATTPSSTAIPQETSSSGAPVQSEKKAPTPASPVTESSSSTVPANEQKNKKTGTSTLIQAIKEPTPMITIDFENEQLIGFDSSGTYELRFGQRIEPVSGKTTFPITDDMMSKWWYITKKGNVTTTEDSDEQELKIPGRGQLPEDWINVVDETVKGANDGKLIGVNQSYEYRLVGENWERGIFGGWVTDLAPGTYEIRLSDGKTFASPSIYKTIKAALPKHSKPNITIDYEKEILQGFNPTATYQLRFEANNIKTVTGVTEKAMSEDMFGKGCRVVQKGDESVQDSDGQELSINHRQALYDHSINAIPESAKDMNDGQLEGVDPEMQYRLSGTIDWTTGPPKRVVKDLPPGKYEVRYKGNNELKRFVSVTVVKTIEAGLPREATPAVTIDYEKEELTGFDPTSSYEVIFDQNTKHTVTGAMTFKITEDMFSKGWRIMKLSNDPTTQDSEAQRVTITGRQTLHESWLAVTHESAQGENDGKLEGVSFDREYRKAGETEWIRGSSGSSTVENLSPGDYEVRYRGSNQYNKFASLIVTKTIEAGLPREEKPSVAIDYETEEVTGFDSNSKYEFRYNREIHTVENQTTFSIPETMFGKVWNVFKLGDGSTTQNSEAQSLSIKARRHLPEDAVTPVDESAKGENDGQLKNVGFDREYRKVGELTWNKGTGNGTIDKLAPGDYEIRYRANKNAETFASLPITKTIKAGLPREATPSVAIDYETEEITGFDSNSKYKLSFNQEIYTVENQTTFSIPEAMFGKGWNVVKLGNGSTTQNSVAQSLGIKARRYLPGNSVTPVDESAKGENDGQLKNVGLDREYRKVGELSWTTGARNGTIEDLAPGDYEIRYRANKNAEIFASLPITKTIKAGLPREALPMIKIDFEQEKLTGFLATAKYELSFGTTIIKVENQTELSITDTMMNGQTWQIIQKAQDSTKLDSKPQSLIIPERPSLLADDIETVNESTAGKNDGQLLGVLPTLEYRLAGNSDWLTGATDGVIRNLRPGNYDIRQRASNQQQSFAGIILTKTIKQGEQVPEQSVTVTFESNGGSSIDPQKVKKGDSIKEPKAPTRKGYIFSGWYVDKKLQQRWNFKTAITKDITLYAKWEQESEHTDPTNTTDASRSEVEETKQSSNVIGSPADSSKKTGAPQNGTQKQAAKQYPKANDTSSAIHWLGIGLVLLGFAGLLLRRKKVEE